MDFGYKIRELQRINNVPCHELSKRLGVLPQQLSRWRQAEDLKFSTIKKLSEIFGMSVNEFIQFGEGRGA